MARSVRPRAFPPLRGYRRVLVAVSPSLESFQALHIACRLAADQRATVTAISVLEVPPLLPLDAHMAAAEAEALELLERAGATGDAYGVKVARDLIRARSAGDAILERAAETRVELIVIAAPRTTVRSRRDFSDRVTLEHVLRGASCRVLVVAPTAEAA
jgi:nucleotide-binding universal stress UspA family protein